MLEMHARKIAFFPYTVIQNCQFSGCGIYSGPTDKRRDGDPGGKKVKRKAIEGKTHQLTLQVEAHRYDGA